jgi:PAS domain S-box-containing protein
MTVDNKNSKGSAAAAAAADEAGVAQALREHAESVSRRHSALRPDRLAALSPEAVRDLLHELQVHQIELEMQNEELRRAQLELDASRARYFDLYDLAPVGYCSVSEQGLILQANLAAATLLGSARGGLVGQPINRFIFKADQDTWYRHHHSLMQTGHAQTLELRMVRPDRSQVWVEVAATAAPDASPPVIRVALFDVSDRKTMEVAMRESEGRYRDLVEWSPVAMLAHLGGKIVFANPVAIKLLGARAANALEGKALLDLIHPDFHPTLLAGLKKMADQGGGAPMAVLRCLKLDGTAFDVEAQSMATSYDGKQVTLTSLHNISARTQVDALASS